jgi:hypothetical protein
MDNAFSKFSPAPIVLPLTTILLAVSLPFITIPLAVFTPLCDKDKFAGFRNSGAGENLRWMISLQERKRPSPLQRSSAMKLAMSSSPLKIPHAWSGWKLYMDADAGVGDLIGLTVIVCKIDHLLRWKIK